MTPKEEAKELVDSFLYLDYSVLTEARAKQCALIAVDKIIDNCKETTKLYSTYDIVNSDVSCQPLSHWQEVKRELEK